jgi:TonB family protein
VPANNVAGAKLETKPAVKPSSNNSSNPDQKTSPTLPGSMPNAADKLNGSGSVELATARTNSSTEAQVINVDSEPPPPAPKPILKPVSGGVLNGTAISLPSPSYPEAARRLRMAGLVTVEVVVDETGKVISAVALSGPSVLRDVAIQAALRARFSPTKLSGQPVKVTGSINYKFTLSQ